jgi:hypothetical protein
MGGVVKGGSYVRASVFLKRTVRVPVTATFSAKGPSDCVMLDAGSMCVNPVEAYMRTLEKIPASSLA